MFHAIMHVGGHLLQPIPGCLFLLQGGTKVMNISWSHMCGLDPVFPASCGLRAPPVRRRRWSGRVRVILAPHCDED